MFTVALTEVHLPVVFVCGFDDLRALIVEEGSSN